jgi:hypothetical protein
LLLSVCTPSGVRVDSITKVGTVFLSLETYFARECSLTAQRAPHTQSGESE